MDGRVAQPESERSAYLLLMVMVLLMISSLHLLIHGYIGGKNVNFSDRFSSPRFQFSNNYLEPNFVQPAV